MRVAIARSLPCAVLVGCYAPHPPDGVPCAADGTCPSPLHCHFGQCFETTPPCVPVALAPGKLAIPKLRAPLVVDGDLSDWPTCFVTVDQTSAGLVRDLGANGAFTPGRFSLASDGARLYVGAEVTSVLPLGNALPPDVFLNNAISVYFDGDGSFTTTSYDADAAQIVVDHANREQAFRTGQTIATVGLLSAATTGPSTFTIEMALEPSTFGLAEFGAQIGFDIGLVGGDGTVMTSELVWYQACAPPTCTCANGTTAAPFCDAREFGTATFAP